MTRLLLLLFFAFTPSAWSAESISQRTSAPCSPVVADVKGPVEIKIICKKGVDPASVKLILRLLNDGLPRLEEQQRQILQILTSKILDTQELQQIITSKYAAIFAQSSEDAEKWTKELLESSQHKIDELRSLTLSDKEIAEKLSLQWYPMYDFILSEFDNRVSELAKMNLLKPQAKPEHNPYYKGSAKIVVAGEEPSDGQVWIRDVRFPNGGVIQIFLSQGAVRSGRIQGPQLRWQESAGSVGGKPFHYSFGNTEFTHYPELGGGGTIYRPKTSDPLLDDEFRRKISTAIGDSIKFVYLHDAASRRK